MWQDNIYLNIGESVKVDGRYYTVEGAIQYQNVDDPSGWTEYKLIGELDLRVVWLSVDNTYAEYALYHESNNKTKFDEVSMTREGYKRVEFGQAEVVAVRGPMDVVVRDRVRYETYEDGTEEKVMSIEVWDDEIEYATGYYVNGNEVQRVDRPGRINETYIPRSNTYSKKSSYVENSDKTSFFKGIKIGHLLGIGFLIFIIGGLFSGINSGKTIIKNYLDKNSNYSYITSLTSDLQSKHKAKIYKTHYTVDEATKHIIDAAYNHIDEVQDNKEDGATVILTEDEYCLIYLNDNNETLIQVSSRKYVYSSTMMPYRSRMSTHRFYRNYYYSRGYSRDSVRYSSLASGYTKHTEAFNGSDGRNTYTPYVSSVRQSSAASRTSSGGGTSSGK